MKKILQFAGPGLCLNILRRGCDAEHDLRTISSIHCSGKVGTRRTLVVDFITGPWWDARSELCPLVLATVGSVEATVSFRRVGNLPERVAWREDRTFLVPSATPAHEAHCWALIHKCCVCNVVLTLTADLDMVKCTSDVNRDKLFFRGVGCEMVVVMLYWMNGICCFNQPWLGHVALNTMRRGGESLWLKAWVIRKGYWPLIKSRIALAKAAFYKEKILFSPSHLDLNLSNKLVKCCILSTALYGAGIWALWKLGHK